MSNLLKIIHDSDLHYGKRAKNGPRMIKENNPDEIIRLHPDIIIVTGDLTENGYSEDKKFCWWGGKDQLGSFHRNYVKPIDEEAMLLCLCVGNHDRGERRVCYTPVRDYVKKRHKSIMYSLKEKGVLFICCGEYPKNIKRLREMLEEDTPTFIFFHFNIIAGEPYSDWWGEDEKEKFYDAINGYNIKAILCGHHHNSSRKMWNGIPIIKSGNEFAMITYDIDSDEIKKVKFYSSLI